MKGYRLRTLPVLLAVLMMTASLTGLPAASAQSGGTRASGDQTPPFDFNDDFYRQNGFVPENILMRIGTPGVREGDWMFDTTSDPTRRGVRDKETTGGWNASGALIYYNIFGMAMPNIFERDAAGNLTARGARAKEIANSYRAFLFPKASAGSKLDPGLPNRRQDNVFDTRNGYFSNNPTGIWILAFVVFTPKASTAEGKKILDPIAATNGRDLDGTPILQSASQIDGLVQEGLVELRFRAQDGSQGFPWVF
ncbi:MAG: hypothetical protein LC802_22785 [Acidobacteria bacterium]|nr:hypothetical protein [Acidobacteriota bacterium]